MSLPLTLAQLLSGLVNSFQSIDVRCAVKRHESGWLSLLTVIRISARPPEAVQERYQDLENDGLLRNADPFRILWQAYPIDQIERILTELASAQLSIEGESVRFPEQVDADKLQGRLEYAPNLILPWDGQRWPATVYYSSGNRTLYFSDPEIVVGVRRSGWRSAEAMVDHFLGLNPRDLYSTNIPLFFYVEMPAKIEVRALVNTMPEILLRTQPTLSDFTLYLSTDRHKGRPLRMSLEKYGQEGIWTLHRSPLELTKLGKV